MATLAGTAQSADFDHTYPSYQRVLQAVKGQAVDYTYLKDSHENLTDQIFAISTVTELEYTQWSPEQQIAFWLNTYNVATLQLVLDHYPIQKSMGLKAFTYPEESIQQIPRVWERPAIKVLGDDLSLNKIEHEILRKEFEEPRIHFALVCASVGCPSLRPEPYIAPKLEAQLADQLKVFLNDPKKYYYDAERDMIHLSPIFKWFRGDFDRLGGVRALLKRMLPETAITKKTRIHWLPYDWTLNDAN